MLKAADLYGATLQLALAAGELERIDSAILRVDREIASQRQRKQELIEQRAKVERRILTPIKTTA